MVMVEGVNEMECIISSFVNLFHLENYPQMQYYFTNIYICNYVCCVILISVFQSLLSLNNYSFGLYFVQSTALRVLAGGTGCIYGISATAASTSTVSKCTTIGLFLICHVRKGKGMMRNRVIVF